MINLYYKNMPRVILNQMYKILIENLFITYPKFLNERDKHDNKRNYEIWTNMINNTDNYKVLTYEEENKVIGFLNFSIIEDELWISEVQIDNNYKNKQILKKLLKKFVYLEDINKYSTITIHINNDNEVSKKVFTHIGFKQINNCIYKIDLEDMKKWLNK